MLKHPRYRNYCIDYNRILHSDRDHQVLFANSPQINNNKSIWRTATILKNRNLLIYPQRIVRHKIWHDDLTGS